MKKALHRLSENGVLAVLQNNRDFIRSKFLSEYESLLEEMSPGYSRYYRSFDFQTEIADCFDCNNTDVCVDNTCWTMSLPIEAFTRMSLSSTQVQRALDTHGDLYLERLEALLTKYQQAGKVDLLYESQLVNIALVTARTIYKHNYKRVGLLRVEKTMEGDFYRKKLEALRVDLIVPDKYDRCMIHQKIMSELVLGKFQEDTQKNL